MRELSNEEVSCVSAAGIAEAVPPLGLAVGIGTATWGTGWGAVVVGAAWAAAPIAVVAISGLTLYAAYKYVHAK